MKISTKVAGVILSIFPGLGQILTGRYLRGFIFFFSFLVLLDLALIILPCVWGSPLVKEISHSLLIASGIIWLYNVIDILRIIWWRERLSLAQKKNPFFQKMIAFYLQNNLPETRKQLQKILNLDRDDSDALFYLGVISHRQGKHGRARRYFNLSLQLDETEKWRWQVNKILAE